MFHKRGRFIPREGSATYNRSTSSNIKYEVVHILQKDKNEVALYLQNNLQTFTEYLEGNLSSSEIVNVVYLMQKFAKSELGRGTKSSIFTKVLPTAAWKIAIFIINLPLSNHTERDKTNIFHNRPTVFWISLFEMFEEIITLEEKSHRMHMEKIYSYCEHFIKDDKNRMIYEFSRIPKSLVDAVKHYLDSDNKSQLKNIKPTYEEVINWIENDDVKAPEVYNSSEEYFKRQFLSLRSEFMSHLCASIQKLKESIELNLAEITEFRVFQNCMFAEANPFGKYLVTVGAHYKDDEITESGTLLCFSNDNYKTFFFGVFRFTNPVIKEADVSLFEHAPFIFEGPFTMAEYKLQYYVGLKSILESIRKSFYSNLPMKEYVLFKQNKTRPPSWYINLKECLPPEEVLQLNEEQYKVFQHVFSSELAIISGCPGSGKTRIVLNVIKTLLINQHTWRAKDTGPILILAFTNGSLDNFLEKILPITDSIVRLGGQCKSESLKECIFGKERTVSCAYEMKEAIKTVFSNIEETLKQIEDILSYAGLIKIEELISDDLQCEISNEDFYDKLMRGSVPAEEQNERIQLMNDLEEIGDDKLVSVKNVSSSLYFVTIRDLQTATYKRGRPRDAQYLKWRLSHKEAHRKFYPKGNEKITNTSINQMMGNELWGLYFFLLDKYIAKKKNKLRLLEEHTDIIQDELRDQKGKTNALSVKEKNVVALTFSGAAQRKSFLEHLAPRIIIVEEASETEDYHIIGTLPQSCEHLILIGDNKLVNFETGNQNQSLIERLSAQNYPNHPLTVQYRMRPEISYLLKSLFYPSLKDDESTFSIPNVRGVSKNVYFIDHNVPNDDAEYLNWKKAINSYEVRYFIEFSKFLISKGYSPESITILTTTTYQAIEFDKAKENNDALQKIESRSIDKFRSLQNDIILLSLVGINEHYSGFLTSEKRLCTALSRAKQGLYIMGNMENLCKEYKVWSSINNILVEQKCIGKALPLHCNLHEGNCISVERPEDFSKANSQLHLCGHDSDKLFQ